MKRMNGREEKERMKVGQRKAGKGREGIEGREGREGKERW